MLCQLFEGAHVVVYRSDCRYLPFSIHFSEFMPINFNFIFFMREQTKLENYTCDTKMAREALILREL